MLRFIEELPKDKRIAGVHCVPVLDNGNMIMAWDYDEQVLTTIGGRLEKGESISEGLNREVFEETGIILKEISRPFASWYWKETDTYTIYFLAEVKQFQEMLDGFEKTGYVITNFRTAIEMIKKIEGRKERIEIIKRAGILSGQLNRLST